VQSREDRIENRLAVPLLIGALLTIPALVLQQGKHGEPWDTIGTVLDWAIWLLFLFELVVMLAVVESKRTWLRQHPLEVAIVVLTPPFLFAALQSIRVLRVLRLLRLFRFAPLARRFFSMQGARYAAVIALLILLAGAEAFAQQEGKSVWEGIYWAITTMTTVGYGVPEVKSEAGKIIACVLMLSGIGFFSIITAAFAQRFLAGEVAEVEEAVETVEETDAYVLKEVREITERLQRLELMVERRRRRKE
jgi:voltage-gated potassium channel